MSKACETFSQLIKDAENLVTQYNALNTKLPQPGIDILKRAGLNMAMTAWETCVEVLLQEATAMRLYEVRNRKISRFMTNRLVDEI